jgi:predicted outer membrane repeat protein
MVAARLFLPLLLISLLLQSTVVPARTWHISPDGSGDASAIQAGLDSSTVGDTVLVACGTYYESGIPMKSGVVLCSETGQADCATIDAQRTSLVIICVNFHEPTEIVGFTLTNGWMPLWEYGGGMFCTGCTDLTVSHCTFLNNHADIGGGLSCEGTTLEMVDCVFRNNSAVSYGGGLFSMNNAWVNLNRCVFDSNSTGRGGGIACGTATLWVENCTLFGNRASVSEYYGEPGGGGLYIFGESATVLENTIIASSASGEGIWSEDENVPEVWCCDIWGNTHGDWVGCVADWFGVHGNFSEDPKFCDTQTGNFEVETCSPCLPGNHPDGYDCGVQVGAFLSGCECGAATEPTTWSSIKAMYR